MYKNWKWKNLLLVIVILLLLSGCTANNALLVNGESPDQAENGMKIPEGDLDDDFTDQLINEQTVSDAYVVVADNNVLANVEVKQNVPEEDVLELVQRYADQLKSKYPDYKLSFSAHQNGSLIIDLEQ